MGNYPLDPITGYKTAPQPHKGQTREREKRKKASKLITKLLKVNKKKSLKTFWIEMGPGKEVKTVGHETKKKGSGN